MVAWSSQFVPPLLRGQHNIRDDIGTDIMMTSVSQYRINLEILCLIGMVMKMVQNVAPLVATDAAWQSLLNTAIDTGPNGDRSGWPGWILLQVLPGDLGRYGGTLTDTVPQLQAKIDAWHLANPGNR